MMTDFVNLNDGKFESTYLEVRDADDKHEHILEIVALQPLVRCAKSLLGKAVLNSNYMVENLGKKM